MSEQAYLELQVGTRDFLEAARILRDLPNAAAAAEAGTKRWVRTHEDAAEKAAAAAKRQADAAEKAAEKAAAAAKRQADAAEKAAQREAQAWNDAIQKAKGAADRKAEAAEKSAKRQADAAEKAARRENEIWNDQLQRAKARYEKQAAAAEAAARREAAAAEKAAARRANAKDAAAGTSGFGAAGLVVGGAALAAGAVIGHELVNTTREFDRLNAALITATGSSDNAEAAFKRIQKIATETPFSLQEVTDSFVKLKNYGLNPSERAIRSYGDTASSLGKNMNQMIEAVADAATGEFERLKEFGVLARQKGEDVTLTFRGMSTTVKRNAQEIEEYLIKLGENNFAGAMTERMKTLDGAISNLKDEWSKLMLTLSKDGGLGIVVLSGVTTAIEALTKLGDAVSFFTGSDTLEAHMQKLENQRQRRTVKDWASSPSNTDSQWSPKAVASEDELGRYREDPAKLARERARKELEAVTQSIRTKMEVVEDAYLKEKNAIINGTTENGELRISMMKKLDAKYKKEVEAAQKADAGPKKKGPKENQGDAFFRKLQVNNQAGVDRRADAAAEAGAREYEQIKNNLTRQEDSVKASYERQKAFLATYTGPDAAELLAANEVLWEKHNAKLKQQEEVRTAEEKAQHDEAMELLLKGNEKIMAEAQKQEDQYAKLLARGIISEQEFTQLKVQLHIEANQKIADSNMELALQSTQNAEAIFGGLATASKNWGGEQSNTYKAMFAAQKAFALASATVSMAHGISSAMDKGWPEGIPLALSAAAEGAKILAMISSANYSGAHDKGGYIPSGKVGIVGEYGPEFVRGPANVTSRRDTARILDNATNGGGGSQQPIINLRVVNAPDGRANKYRVSSAREQVVISDMRKNQGAVRRLAGVG